MKIYYTFCTEKRRLVILSILDGAYPGGLYGSDIVRESKGKVGRGVVYTDLNTLWERGLIREEVEESITQPEPGRTKHFIIGSGKKVLNEQPREGDNLQQLEPRLC